VLAVLGAGDHRQAGVHGTALGGVVGDGVPELGIVIGVEQEVSVGPAALPGVRVGIQGAAHDEAVLGDGLDAEPWAIRNGTMIFSTTPSRLTWPANGMNSSRES
jgi:hypothetical protein